MANVIRHKRGTSNPVAGDFSETAELLVNTTDGGLFTKTDGGSVVEIGADADTLDGIQGSSFLRSDAADTATGAITFSGGQTWNSNITWGNARNIYVDGESSFDVRSGGQWHVWDASTSSNWITASYGQPLYLNNNALTAIVQTSSDTDYFRIRHRTDTDVTIDFWCESQTAKIADSFSDTTTDKKYIYFSNPNSSNDPGYILHETSNSETNEGVLHLVPSDDNAENDYVSIHGTNDPDRIRLHTSGLIETVNSTDLYLRSGSGTIKTDDDIQLESSADLVFYDTNGTFPTAAGAFKWTLNNDSASIYAQQPQSDWIDFFFKITDNAGSTDRFVFWIDDYRGATYDKYPAHFDGSAQYLSVPVNGSGDKDLSNARFKVPFSGDVVIDGSKVWHAGNDGSGSGLDADTVDGIQSTGIVYGTAGAAVNGLSATQNVYELGQYKAGFWDANGASWTPNTGWWWGATFAHRSNTSSYNYSGQLAFENGNGGNGIYARTISNGTASSWSKLWSDGNDGSGSGLDADTVDGVHASSFFQANNALSATTGAFSGDVTMSGTGALKVANGTTAQRPTAATGQIRYNTTLGAIESYVQGAWQVIANTALDYGLITSASDTTFDYGALS